MIFVSEQERLRAAVRRLRIENQQLHMRIEDAMAGTHLRRGDPRRTVRSLRRCLLGLMRRLRASSQSAQNHIGSGEDFEPYMLRVSALASAQRPRVMHVIANMYVGGSAQLVVDLIERLSDHYEQVVAARDLPSHPAYTGLELHHVTIGQARNASRLEELFNCIRPDLLHVHFLGHHNDDYSQLDWNWYHHYFRAAERRDIPVIQNLNIPVAPYISPACRAYVHVSDYVRREYGDPECHNITIHPGSDVRRFTRKQGPAPEDVVGMVYRLEHDKLNEHAIDVLIRAVQLRPQTRALVVGGGTLLEPYREAVRKAGLDHAFTFTGYVSYVTLPTLYKRMSVFVAPVHWESFGQVVPFAMAMQLPVAAYDAGALTEIIDDNSLLAPVGESDALARIIVGLLDDRERQRRIGAANRARVESLFSVESMIEAYDALYASTLGLCRA